MAQWRDKVVIINAPIDHYGRAVIKLLQEEGVKHVTILDTNVEFGESLQREFTEKHGHGKVKFMKCDATDEKELLASFEKVLSEQGHVDVVVNYPCVVNDTKEVYKRMIATNFTSLVTSTLKSLEVMSKENGGRGGTIINVSSIVALYQSALLPIYSASKGAVLRFSNSIGRQEYFSRTGVRVISVCLGAYDTPLMHPDNVATYDRHINATLEDEFGKLPMQSLESVAGGFIDVYKYGDSGSTWILTSNRPVKDITSTIDHAYGLMAKHVFE